MLMPSCPRQTLAALAVLAALAALAALAGLATHPFSKYPAPSIWHQNIINKFVNKPKLHWLIYFISMV
jgi:hypothetical protein